MVTYLSSKVWIILVTNDYNRIANQITVMTSTIHGKYHLGVQKLSHIAMVNNNC